MCGIAGALVYEPKIAQLDRFLTAVDTSALRGKDAFGVIRWSPSSGFKHYRHKSQQGKDGWLQSIGCPEKTEATIYIHTSRAEPTTEWLQEKSETDIPPFVEMGIAAAHNGIIANDDELVAKHKLARISSIDTAIIPSLVASIGVWKAVAAIRGGFALGIIDSYRAALVLCRNFMPLSLAWEPGIVCFASESTFFSDVDQPFRPYQIWELPPYTGIELYADGYCAPVAWENLQNQQEKTIRHPYPQLNWRTHE
jgi:7-cyano-7-deazaguanine synthase